MNRLKSIFVSLFINAALTFTVLSTYQFFNATDEILAAISIAISGLVVLTFAKFFIFKSPRTSQNFPILTSIMLLLYLGFIAVNFQQNNWVMDLFIYNTITFSGWIVYLKWYSVFPDRNDEALKVGKQFPELSFENTKGEMVTTSKFLGSKIIYLFYRGNWCPLCMAQIKEIAGQYQELADRGVKIALVSPQPQKHTKSLAKKFDVPFIFLRDVENSSAKKLNIFAESGTPLGMEVFGYESDTVMPTVIICDEKGKIIYADLTDNYRIRPEPDAFLEVVNNIS